MNEGKFIEDTRKNCHEFRLINVKRRILGGYKRMLGNKSLNHGLAFTIRPSEQDEVEGICHDVPSEGLEAFLRKEGVLTKKLTSIPTYEIMVVKVSNEEGPVLTLKGLRPFNLAELDCKEKLKVYCYVSLSIQGAKRCARAQEFESRPDLGLLVI